MYNGEDAGRMGKFFVEEQENLKGGMVGFSQILLLWLGDVISPVTFSHWCGEVVTVTMCFFVATVFS